jgi:hypothetical protein
MRFPIYELLYLLNRNLQETRDLLDRIQKSPRMAKDKFKAYQAEVECLRAEATQDVLDVMNSVEVQEMARWSKEKRAYEDSVRDLDDVYFEVQEREEQRRQQGLPSLIGILPRSHQSSSATGRDEARREPEFSEPARLLNARSREKHGATRTGRSQNKAGGSTKHKSPREMSHERQDRPSSGGSDGEE